VSGQGGSGTPAPAGGASNVRIPATFTIRPGERVSPTAVSAPAFLAVRVTVIARDGRAHRVVIQTPQPHALDVPAGGRASTLIPGQRAGSYPVLVDGAPRARLELGGEPGP
jgi:hypothetical protein